MNEFTKEEIEDARRIVKEVYNENGVRAKRLRDKCRWEGMTPVAVMLDWPTLFDEIDGVSK